MRGISARDVATDLGVSRRLADLRFRQFSGYTDLAYLKTPFKRRFGLTMRAYRAQHKDAT